MIGHPPIDFFRQTDKARIESVLACFQKIMRVERNAVSTDTGTDRKA
jgi:hypothetical protein